MKALEIYIDGASKGNPGHAGIGAVISAQGTVIKNCGRYIGETTNNIAEYSALLEALRQGRALGAEELVIYTDSQLMHRQVRGQYKVRDPGIASLYLEAMRLMQEFKRVTVHHIDRERNKGADKMATLAVKEFLSKGVREVAAPASGMPGEESPGSLRAA